MSQPHVRSGGAVPAGEMPAERGEERRVPLVAKVLVMSPHAGSVLIDAGGALVP